MSTPTTAPRTTARLSVGRKRYLEALAAMVLAAVIAKAAAGESDLAALLVVLTALATTPLAFLVVRWLWRKLTYRVGVRLFLSYLLIGLAPFPLVGVLAAVAGSIAVGQYASVQFGAAFERWREALVQVAHEVSQQTPGKTADAERRALLAVGASPPAGLPRVDVLAGRGGAAGAVSSPTLDPALRAAPAWLAAAGADDQAWSGVVVADGKPFLTATERRAGRFAAAFLPLDVDTLRRASTWGWFDARVVASRKVAMAVGASKRSGEGIAVVVAEPGKAGGSVRVGGEPVPADEVEGSFLTTRLASGDWWHRLTIPWARPFATPRSWEAGAAAADWRVFSLLKVSVGGAIDDFFTSPRPLAREISIVLRATAAFFGFLYLLAVAFAAVMILRVTRSTARLTRGARAVALGDLDYRIPVKRRDQLGELAVSFNSMTESVRSMLAQVAEKERMAREVELAREIQSSLLPPAELASGPLAVVAYFRPATEVGGDYFDLFPLAPGHLTVAIGDVAGHGLPTGLLMAMVKSAVAALIEEGHRGADLLSRLNHLLLAQSLRQRMVSFALAEIDAPRAEVEITSAGHPPGVLLAADGGVEEVLLASLPLGHRWPDQPASERRPFPPGSRLVLYSDGLVEGRDAAGEAFGYDTLRAALVRHRELSARELLSALLAELDRHLAGQPLADDLTVLVVEHAPTAS